MRSKLEPFAARWRESQWAAAAEIAIIVALVAGDYYGVVPVTSTPFFLVLGWLSLRLRGLGWRDVGFVRPPSWSQPLVVGSLAGIVASALFGWGHGGQGLTACCRRDSQDSSWAFCTCGAAET